MDIKSRLKELEKEQAKGQLTQTELQNNLNRLQTNLIAIGGAIAILKELLAENTDAENQLLPPK